MAVHKVIVLLISLLCAAWDSSGVEATETSLAGVTSEMIIAKLGLLESQIKQANQKNEQMRQELQTLSSKNDVALFMISSSLNVYNMSIRSCKKSTSKPSGKYIIQPTRYDALFLGVCEQTVFGGGWLVFQYRNDGSVDFFRKWTEYQNGFGNADGEFWLGLECLHRLTKERPHELLVELKDFNGEYSYARYDAFEIGSEAASYDLKKLGIYEGTAFDGLDYHRGKKFSTVDRDNDRTGGNCAAGWKGGWWYNDCGISDLNGPYGYDIEQVTMSWDPFKGYTYSRMLIREK